MHPRDLSMDNSQFSPSLRKEEASAETMPLAMPIRVEPPVDQSSCSSGSGALSTEWF